MQHIVTVTNFFFAATWAFARSWCRANIVLRGWRILIPHEDKVDVITPFNIGHRRWRIWIPHEDKSWFIIPINVLFRGGGEFRSLFRKLPSNTGIVSVMSQFWILAKVKVADNLFNKLVPDSDLLLVCGLNVWWLNDYHMIIWLGHS